MKLARTPFVPARNSRHRIAAIAVYRALVKAARQISIPDSLRHHGPVHPVAHLVRKRFDSHKLYTSTRLVYSSMANAYRFLTMLTKAKESDSPEYRDIIRLLRQRRQHSEHSRQIRPARPPAREPRPPLIISISGPGEPPVYLGTPRPDDQIRGKRRVPLLAAVAEGQPFLRYVKPQPPVLSRMIGRRRKLWVKRVQDIKLVEDQEAPLAALEDQWEHLMLKQMKKEQGFRPSTEETNVTSTFTWSALLGKLWYEHSLERNWEDWTARGKAMYNLIQAERALVEGKQPPPLPELPIEDRQMNKKPHNVVVGREGMPTIISGNRVSRQFGGSVSPYDKTADPFASPIWAGIVNYQSGRVHAWVSKTQYWDSSYGVRSPDQQQKFNQQNPGHPSRPPSSSSPGGWLRGSPQTQKSYGASPRQSQSQFNADNAIAHQQDIWGVSSQHLTQTRTGMQSGSRHGADGKTRQYQSSGNSPFQKQKGGSRKAEADTDYKRFSAAFSKAR